MERENAGFFELKAEHNVANLILDYLALEDVDHIFGIPGGGLKEMLNALRVRESEFRYVICRQETGAVFIADGYHRVTGKLGVVMVTSGPGATNALTGSMNAQADHSALLTLTGEVPEQYVGMGYLQGGIAGSLKMETLYRNAVDYSQMLSSPDNLHTLMAQALRNAMNLPRRAVHLSLPNSVSELSPSKPTPFPKSVENYRCINMPSSPSQCREALDMLLGAERPLIFLGNGNRFTLRGERLQRFCDFVDKFAIPVMTTPDGKGVFPESHCMSLRTFGLASCEWTFYYLNGEGHQQYDGLMVIGSMLGELATRKWDPVLVPNGPFIQIDADHSVIGRSFPISLGIVSDAGMAMDAMMDYAEEVGLEPDDAVEKRREFIDHIKQRPAYFAPQKRDSEQVPILPQHMSKIIDDELPDDCHIFIDGGNCIGWALHYMVVDPPRQMHNSLDMGPMGFGTCAVVGGKMGAPDKHCICLTGDGGFMMQGSEVSTAAQYRLGCIWIVQFNNDLGMVSQGNAHFMPTPPQPSWDDYYKLGDPDLCNYARGLGATVYAVNSPDEMTTALRAALKDAEEQSRPQVIVVNIDTSEVPPYYQPVAE
ncbi:MAG: thiamine pyrophosphate-binding protein [Halieaceae bacterium]|jgi:acetolactate synthase-1/2/3 large subunit|nr:thiamine pyrophosphate-binding protein [Halieaceae bacterium]